MRAPSLKSIYAQEVFARDDFEIILGTEKKIYHRPNMGERGELVAVYAIAEYEGGNKEIVFMNDKQTLLDVNGMIGATWKQREGSVRFDAKAFKAAHPELYPTFETQGEPVRTFLLKKGAA